MAIYNAIIHTDKRLGSENKPSTRWRGLRETIFSRQMLRIPSMIYTQLGKRMTDF